MLFVLLFAVFIFTAGQRLVLEWSFDVLTGARLHVASLTRDGAVTELRGVSLEAAGGQAVLRAPEVTFARAHAGTALRLVEPQVTLHLGHDTLRALLPLERFAAYFHGAPVRVFVANGSLTVRRDGTGAAPLRISAINGVNGHLRGSIRQGGSSYPIAIANRDLHGERIPAEAAAALLPPSDLQIRGGFFTALDVTFGGFPQGTFTLGHVRGRFAGHPFRGLHGTVAFAQGSIATRDIAGFIDGGVPIDAAGEADDALDLNRTLREGTKSLRGLARLLSMIAPTSNLHWIKLESTAPGVAFGQYQMVLDGVPRVVQLVTIDPHEKSLRFDTALSSDHLISKGERTSSMGIRTHAVAGLNGDYFDIAGTYEPQGMFIESGKLLRGPTNRQALIVDSNNRAHFAEFRLHGHLRYAGQALPVTQYNDWPLGWVTVITPDFAHSLTSVPGMRFLSLQPLGGARYRVTGESDGVVPSPIHFGVAVGPDLKNALLPPPGGVVELTYGLDPAVPNAVAGIGGGPLLLRNGKWFEDPDAPAPDERDVRWPVDALGVLSDRTIVMVAVDGRHPERSGGMTRPEFATLLQHLGVTDAMALDSGGSVTLVSRAPGDSEVSVRNVPSDDSAERYVSNGIFVYSSAPAQGLLGHSATALRAGVSASQ